MTLIPFMETIMTYKADFKEEFLFSKKTVFKTLQLYQNLPNSNENPL